MFLIFYVSFFLHWHNDVVQMRSKYVPLTLRELSKYCDFTKDFSALIDILEYIFDEFDCVYASTDPTPSLDNLAIGSTAYQAYQLILVRGMTPY